jgi:hypothetical protein
MLALQVLNPSLSQPAEFGSALDTGAAPIARLVNADISESMKAASARHFFVAIRAVMAAPLGQRWRVDPRPPGGYGFDDPPQRQTFARFPRYLDRRAPVDNSPSITQPFRAKIGLAWPVFRSSALQPHDLPGEVLMSQSWETDIPFGLGGHPLQYVGASVDWVACIRPPLRR